MKQASVKTLVLLGVMAVVFISAVFYFFKSPASSVRANDIIGTINMTSSYHGYTISFVSESSLRSRILFTNKTTNKTISYDIRKEANRTHLISIPSFESNFVTSPSDQIYYQVILKSDNEEEIKTLEYKMMTR
ncbi:MAG: hypothetical protein WCO06_05830 [Candidatus Roizmanbacteria bacterium]